jgi:hypothetical protein
MRRGVLRCKNLAFAARTLRLECAFEIRTKIGKGAKGCKQFRILLLTIRKNRSNTFTHFQQSLKNDKGQRRRASLRQEISYVHPQHIGHLDECVECNIGATPFELKNIRLFYTCSIAQLLLS